MRAAFSGERSAAVHGSGLDSDVYYYYNNNSGNATSVVTATAGNGQLNTPPDEYPFPDGLMGRSDHGGGGGADISAWLEVWDYAGGASFRGFVADVDGEKSLFIFFDVGIIGRDLRPSLMALIELTEAALGCSQMVVCIDRGFDEPEAKELTKGLQWAGFSFTTLEHWAGDVDVTSDKWVFMGMEV